MEVELSEESGRKVWEAAKGHLRRETLHKLDYRQKLLEALIELPSSNFESQSVSGFIFDPLPLASFPVQSLDVILELKAATHDIKFGETARKLIEIWMNSDCLAQALIFITLFKNHATHDNNSERTNFFRSLFLILDTFHLNTREFLQFLLSQIVLALLALVYGIRTDSQLEGQEVIVAPFATFLDRIYLRFHSDGEYFHSEVSPRLKNPFTNFITALHVHFGKDFIARRLLNKILLRFSSQTASKFTKTALLVGIQNESAASKLLSPKADFLSNDSWKHVLTIGIPVKTFTCRLGFWTNWASYVVTDDETLNKEILSGLAKNWGSLCKSSHVDPAILTSTSLALTALLKELNSLASSSAKSLFISIFQEVSTCLESLDGEKRGAGCALAQIAASLAFPKGEVEALTFPSQSPLFKKIVSFYESQLENESQEVALISGGSVTVYDSDDDTEEEELGNQEFEPYDQSNDIGKTKAKEAPVFFTDIHEIFIENIGKKEDDAYNLRLIGLSKIPLLLSKGLKMDSNMGIALTSLILDFEKGEFPLLATMSALYEISRLYSFEVFNTFGKVVFDKDRYTVGHRTFVGNLYREVGGLISKQKCFACFSSPSKKEPKVDERTLALTPEFSNYYKQKCSVRLCSKCVFNFRNPEKILQGIEKEEEGKEELKELTWREIIDRRVAAKTRHFFTTQKKTKVMVEDEYSIKLLPVVWSPLANRLIRFGATVEDVCILQVLQTLGFLLIGASPLSPHLRNIAVQIGELIDMFATHAEWKVRQAAFALLAAIVTTSEGKEVILELFPGSLLRLIKEKAESDPAEDVRKLCCHLLAYVIDASTAASFLDIKF